MPWGDISTGNPWNARTRSAVSDDDEPEDAPEDAPERTESPREVQNRIWLAQSMERWQKPAERPRRRIRWKAEKRKRRRIWAW